MRIEEASHLASIIKGLPLQSISPCLNMGSSTKQYRQFIKPHITDEFIAPLEAMGIKFVHADLKPGDGIDICGDVFDAKVQQELKAINAKSLLLNNVLEHVPEPGKLARICTELVPVGGYLFVTVPYSYPYHADPIDTMYRPSPEAVAKLFENTEMVHSAIVDAGNLRSELYPSRNADARRTAKFFFYLALPFYKPRVWLANAHRLLWLARPYQITVVVLRRR